MPKLAIPHVTVRPVRLAILSLVLWVIFGASVQAQRARPTRAMFEQAVLDLAPQRTRPHQCEGADGPSPSITIPREHRAKVVGRQLELPGQFGRGAVVRVATGTTDANDDFAYRLMFVVLRPGDWSVSGSVEIEPGAFQYDELHVVRVARVEDVDDDGEPEVFIAFDMNSEVECGTGYCTQRQVVVLDLQPTLTLQVRLPTTRTCQTAMADSQRGTVQLRDLDGDGHRDLYHRVITRVVQWDEAGDEPQERRERTITHYIWDPRSDQYERQTP